MVGGDLAWTRRETTPRRGVYVEPFSTYVPLRALCLLELTLFDCRPGNNISRGFDETATRKREDEFRFRAWLVPGRRESGRVGRCAGPSPRREQQARRGFYCLGEAAPRSEGGSNKRSDGYRCGDERCGGNGGGRVHRDPRLLYVRTRKSTIPAYIKVFHQLPSGSKRSHCEKKSREGEDATSVVHTAKDTSFMSFLVGLQRDALDLHQFPDLLEGVLVGDGISAVQFQLPRCGNALFDQPVHGPE